MKYTQKKQVDVISEEQLKKYIREIQAMKNPLIKSETPENDNPTNASFIAAQNNNESCSFKSKGRKFEFSPDQGVPGPGAYQAASISDTTRTGKFNTAKRSLNCLNYNNTLLIKAKETSLPCVGQYFQQKFRRIPIPVYLRKSCSIFIELMNNSKFICIEAETQVYGADRENRRTRTCRLLQAGAENSFLTQM